MTPSKPYHLKQLHIKNFACFKDVKLENIKRINMVFGKNGTGKTWLLRAVDLLANAAHSNKNSNRDEPNDLVLSLVSMIKDVENFDSDRPIRIRDVLSRLGYFGSKDIEINGDDNTVKNLGDVVKSSRMLFDEDEFFLRRRFSSVNVFSNHMIYVGGEDSWKARAYRLMDELSSSNTKDQKMFDVIRLFAPQVKSIKPHPKNGLNIFLKDQDDNPLPLGYFGYGFKRLVLMYFFCMINQHNILGIDEFENGLHFDKQKQVAESLLNASQQFNTQLFVTSHSQECSLRFLEAVESGKYQDDFSCFYLERDEDGEIKAASLDFEGAQYLLKETSEDSSYRMV